MVTRARKRKGGGGKRGGLKQQGGRTRRSTRVKVEADQGGAQNQERETETTDVGLGTETEDLDFVPSEEEPRSSGEEDAESGGSDDGEGGGGSRSRENGGGDRRGLGSGSGSGSSSRAGAETFFFSKWFEEARSRSEDDAGAGPPPPAETEAYDDASLPIKGLKAKLPKGQAEKVERYRLSRVKLGKPNSDSGRPQSVRECIVDDVATFAGGPIWSLDWSPSVAEDPATSVTSLHIAVGPHSQANKLNTVNQRQTGLGLIQIMEVACKGDPAKVLDISVAYLIRHNGAVTWDLAWCPAASTQGTGVLAAGLGDGQVCLYCVPGRDPEAEGGTKPLNLKPRLQTSELQKRKSIPSSLAWHPAAPHNTLLVGCWDGNVALFKLSLDRIDLVFFVRADTFPLRKVCWIHERWNSGDKCEMYATAGLSGSLKIWSTNEPQALRYSHTMSYSTNIMDVKLVGHNGGLVFLSSDGRLLYLYSTTNGFKIGFRSVTKNCFSCAALDRDYFVFSTITGEVLVANLRRMCSEKGLPRTLGELPDLCLFSLSMDAKSEALKLDDTVSEQRFTELEVYPAQQVHVYKNAIMPEAPGLENAVGIAHATGSGILRIQLLDRKKLERALKVKKVKQ
ncbi:hypothetical protein HOP50_03g25410 [Chloropicon primus]|uniref:WD40 repeat domain-containing protein n=1 Tax=Chloropicon primus TaxID=1764295 RepID=A0A5B8MKX5_9CHLO|nr:hypothetical protein A3770_03p25400 [Chloropicon primus]UPQ99234.1 hypothetical protein HOP50_03g25410 [Chloropicon primus]|eukprot:QDZ20022.1 hypothetical protein A3770_03p25400 [Chloropicon primus]